MTLIKTESVEPGMVTLKDVKNQRNQVLIPKGVTLTEKHIGRLVSFSIPVVDIKGEGEEIGKKVRLSPADKKKIDNIVALHFKLNEHQLNDSAVSELMRLHSKQIATTFKNFPDSLYESKGVALPEISEKWCDLENLLQKTDNLYSLPSIYQKLIKVMDRPDAPISEMGEIISSDPSLSLRLLKVANSAYYSLNSKLETVSKAIVVIGIEDIKSMVLASTVTDTFSDELDTLINMQTFWKHSIACGTLAKNISISLNDSDPERFFVMGLLHDIGKLIMYSQIPSECSSIERYAFENCERLHSLELNTLGYTHTKVGSHLLNRWNFPVSHQDALANHHSTEGKCSHRMEANIIHLADTLAHVIGCSVSCPSHIPCFDVNCLDFLRIDIQTLRKIIKDSSVQITELSNEFLL